MSDYEDLRHRIQELADTFRVKAHLAEMDAKVAWNEEIEPTIKRLETGFEKALADMNVPEELEALESRLRNLVGGLEEE